MTVIEERFATFTGEIHPYADRWPMRSADEIEAMADSIAANGLRFPIVITPDGVLVDGRNRLRACEVAGILPRWEVREELTGEDAIVAFIWDANGDRRDMSKGAKAMLAALGGGTVRSLSERTNVALDDLRANRPDLADLVDAGRLTLGEALTLRAHEAEKQRRSDALAKEKRRKLNADFSVHVVTLAGLGQYPDRVDDLLNDWDATHQVVPVTPDLIDAAIRGLSAVAEHIQGETA